MAETKSTKRVAVITADGQFGTVEEHEAGLIEQSGGRVLTRQETIAAEQRAAYDAKGTGEKVIGGVASTLAGPIVGNALAGTGAIAVAPQVQAFQQGEAAALTGGLDQVAVMKGLEVVAGKDAAKAYGRNQLEISQANEGWKTAGELTGFGVTALSGNVGGAARALPGIGIQALGGAAENVAARALGGVAARGFAGRAVATGVELGARGAVEGALYGAANELTEEVLGDRDLAADKIFAASGHGALMGGMGGALLGGTGSVAKSAVVGTARAARGGLARVMGRAEQAASEAGPRGEPVPFIDAAAGLREAAPDAVDVFSIGREVQPIGVRPQGGARRAASAESPISIGKWEVPQIDPDAGIAAIKRGSRGRFERQGPVESSDGALRFGKPLPREVSLGDLGEGAIESATKGPIRLPRIEAPGAGAELGAKGLAYEQAWKAVAGGFGLQTTRYAKQAAKYFPNGARDIGETLIRKGVINAEGGLTDAFRGGHVADLAPRIASELDTVGSRIGDITSASPARVDVATVQKAIDDVTRPFAQKAGRESVVSGIEAYGDSLLSKLRTRPDGTVSLQDLLFQRKALDELVYDEVKRLDPGGRVGALRDLRGKIEGVITDALDDASGKVSGELRGEYQALKKDYHALSIAKEAAEDSVARASKGGTLGLTDKIIGGAASTAGAFLGGGIGAAATGAAGAFASKMARERGNAVAAVLLHRASDMATIAKALRAVDGQMARASQGLLVPPKRGPLPELPQGTARERATAYQRQIAEWQANPQAFVDRIAERTESLNVNAPELAGAITQRMTDAFAFMASKMPSPPPPDPFNPRKAPPLTDSEAAKLARYGWYVDKPARFFDEVAHGKLTFEGLEVARALMPGAFAELQQRTAEGLVTLASQGRQPPYNQREALGALLGFPAVPSQRPDHAQFLQQNMLRSMSQEKTGPAPRPSSSKPTQRSALDRLESGGPGR